MNSKQTLTFATIEDWRSLLIEFESQFDVEYFETGLFDHSNFLKYDSIFQVDSIGVVNSGDWNRIDRYLVVKRNTGVNIRAIEQRKGGVKYAVDQMANPDSIELKLGGIFKEKENILVAGRIGTVSTSSTSIGFFTFLHKEIRKNFKRIGAFYLGNEAENLLRNKWRLVTNDRSPKEYDLAFE